MCWFWTILKASREGGEEGSGNGKRDWARDRLRSPLTWNLELFRRMFCIHRATTHQFTVPLYPKPRVCGACVLRCNLPPAPWPRSFTCYCGNTGAERIPKWVSAESWLWTKTFSRRSCRDSNPWPSDHESGTLSTELSPLPQQTPFQRWQLADQWDNTKPQAHLRCRRLLLARDRQLYLKQTMVYETT